MTKILIESNKKIKRKISVKKDEIIYIFGKSGGDLDLEIQIAKPGVDAKVYGVLIGQRDHLFNINITSNHMSESTKSRVHLKTICFDNSKINFSGMIKINKKAQLSDAYLQNDNIIVGENAVVNSSPQLEIEADDVKASHGVTIKTLDDVSMYYLQSRGLVAKEAENLLLQGFISDITTMADVKISLSSLIEPAANNE